jgi:hypothetical protein
VCRAFRRKQAARGTFDGHQFRLFWGPWVSAGDQVRGALKRMNEQQDPSEGSFGLWTTIKESKE